MQNFSGKLKSRNNFHLDPFMIRRFKYSHMSVNSVAWKN